MSAPFAGARPHDVFPEARKAADRALALDSTAADAHMARAVIAMFYEWDLVRAGLEFERSIALNPSDGESLIDALDQPLSKLAHLTFLFEIATKTYQRKLTRVFNFIYISRQHHRGIAKACGRPRKAEPMADASINLVRRYPIAAVM
jgi:hypothetical protein